MQLHHVVEVRKRGPYRDVGDPISPDSPRFLLILGKNAWSVEIIEEGGQYRLAGDGAVRIAKGHAVRTANDSALDQLEKKFGAEPFTVQEASEALGVARWITLRALQASLTEARVVRTGKGMATRYRVKKTK